MSDSDGNGAADSEMLYFSTGLVMNFNDTDSELYRGVNAALQYLQRSGIAQSIETPHWTLCCAFFCGMCDYFVCYCATYRYVSYIYGLVFDVLVVQTLSLFSLDRCS